MNDFHPHLQGSLSCEERFHQWTSSFCVKNDHNWFYLNILVSPWTTLTLYTRQYCPSGEMRHVSTYPLWQQLMVIMWGGKWYGFLRPVLFTNNWQWLDLWNKLPLVPGATATTKRNKKWYFFLFLFFILLQHITTSYKNWIRNVWSLK